MTLRDALPMAAARWRPYAMLLAQGHNLQCSSKSKTIDPDDLNPYLPARRKQKLGDDVWIPWDVVAAGLEKMGFQR